MPFKLKYNSNLDKIVVKIRIEIFSQFDSPRAQRMSRENVIYADYGAIKNKSIVSFYSNVFIVL